MADFSLALLLEYSVASISGVNEQMLVRPASCEYRTWILDSRRWESYRPRRGDIVVATYPKCGTTWTQRIVDLLIHQNASPRPLSGLYPWLDQRFLPIEGVIQSFDSQGHRRALKSHLPFDGFPIYDEVFYVHVARDGRDACMSYHNHLTGFTEAMFAQLDKDGYADEKIGRPFPRPPSSPAEFFNTWMSQSAVPGHDDGSPTTSYFEVEKGYWEERKRPNVLLVHYNDLKTDLSGEMRRIAEFLQIEVPDKIWPGLIAAASFEAMRNDGEKLMPQVVRMFTEGANRFFNKGHNKRWIDVFSNESLELYERKADQKLSADCAEWLAKGRIGGDALDV